MRDDDERGPKLLKLYCSSKKQFRYFEALHVFLLRTFTIQGVFCTKRQQNSLQTPAPPNCIVWCACGTCDCLQRLRQMLERYRQSTS